jgi:ATP-dependent Zn protease
MNLEYRLIFKNKEGDKIKKFIFYTLFFFCGSFLFKRIVKKGEESNRNKILNFGKYKAKSSMKKNIINITFQYIAGIESTKVRNKRP